MPVAISSRARRLSLTPRERQRPPAPSSSPLVAVMAPKSKSKAKAPAQAVAAKAKSAPSAKAVAASSAPTSKRRQLGRRDTEDRVDRIKEERLMDVSHQRLENAVDSDGTALDDRLRAEVRMLPKDGRISAPKLAAVRKDFGLEAQPIQVAVKDASEEVGDDLRSALSHVAAHRWCI